MSQGETSCKMFGNCTEFTAIKDCNKECDFYNPKDGKVSKEIDQAVEKELKNEVQIHPSRLEKFDKVNEIVVLKKHVFAIQSVSPKKIILKYKRKLNKTDTLPDGCFVFKNQNDELLIPAKVFSDFDKKARAKKNAKKTKEK